ncbi:hypothetical protein OR1_04176 [Geobacter sp. OR-1]|nr:hypothetical protein OR1_04176 [Geobacter sp. OR-1]
MVGGLLVGSSRVTGTTSENIPAGAGPVVAQPAGGHRCAGAGGIMFYVTGRKPVCRPVAGLVAGTAAVGTGYPVLRPPRMAPGVIAGISAFRPVSGEVPQFQKGNIQLLVDMLDIGPVVDRLAVAGNGIGMAVIAGQTYMRDGTGIGNVVGMATTRYC